MNLIKIRRHFIYFIVQICILWACDSGKQQKIEESKKSNYNSRIYIGDTALFKAITWTSKYLHFGELSKDYFGTELRFWFNYDRRDVTQVVILKSGDQWIAEIHTVYWEPEGDSIMKLAKHVIDTTTPGSGWETFLDSLNSLDVYSLPDQREVEGMILSYNTATVNIETTKDGVYRFYNYTKPIRFINRFSEAQKIEMIMSLIENELKFQRLQFF